MKSENTFIKEENDHVYHEILIIVAFTGQFHYSYFLGNHLSFMAGNFLDLRDICETVCIISISFTLISKVFAAGMYTIGVARGERPMKIISITSETKYEIWYDKMK